jgi:hypothetical protein
MMVRQLVVCLFFVQTSLFVALADTLEQIQSKILKAEEDLAYLEIEIEESRNNSTAQSTLLAKMQELTRERDKLVEKKLKTEKGQTRLAFRSEGAIKADSQEVVVPKIELREDPDFLENEELVVDPEDFEFIVPLQVKGWSSLHNSLFLLIISTLSPDIKIADKDLLFQEHEDSNENDRVERLMAGIEALVRVYGKRQVPESLPPIRSMRDFYKLVAPTHLHYSSVAANREDLYRRIHNGELNDSAVDAAVLTHPNNQHLFVNVKLYEKARRWVKESEARFQRLLDFSKQGGSGQQSAVMQNFVADFLGSIVHALFSANLNATSAHLNLVADFADSILDGFEDVTSFRLENMTTEKGRMVTQTMRHTANRIDQVQEILGNEERLVARLEKLTQWYRAKSKNHTAMAELLVKMQNRFDRSVNTMIGELSRAVRASDNNTDPNADYISNMFAICLQHLPVDRRRDFFLSVMLAEPDEVSSPEKMMRLLSQNFDPLIINVFQQLSEHAPNPLVKAIGKFLTNSAKTMTPHEVREVLKLDPNRGQIYELLNKAVSGDTVAQEAALKLSAEHPNTFFVQDIDLKDNPAGKSVQVMWARGYYQGKAVPDFVVRMLKIRDFDKDPIESVQKDIKDSINRARSLINYLIPIWPSLGPVENERPTADNLEALFKNIADSIMHETNIVRGVQMQKIGAFRLHVKGQGDTPLLRVPFSLDAVPGALTQWMERVQPYSSGSRAEDSFAEQGFAAYRKLYEEGFFVKREIHPLLIQFRDWLKARGRTLDVKNITIGRMEEPLELDTNEVFGIHWPSIRNTDQVLQLLRDAKLDKSFLHGDAHPGNVLRDHNRSLVLIDWSISDFGEWIEGLQAIAIGINTESEDLMVKGLMKLRKEGVNDTPELQHKIYLRVRNYMENARLREDKARFMAVDTFVSYILFGTDLPINPQVLNSSFLFSQVAAFPRTYGFSEEKARDFLKKQGTALATEQVIPREYPGWMNRTYQQCWLYFRRAK